MSIPTLHYNDVQLNLGDQPGLVPDFSDNNLNQQPDSAYDQTATGLDGVAQVFNHICN